MSTVGQLPRITPSEAMAKIREGALAVDIRSQAEYRGGHIVGALSLPPEQQRDKLPDDAAPCLIFLLPELANVQHGQKQYCQRLAKVENAIF